MRLRAIRATNYRTLENIDLAFSPAYCTLSGKNNAGKPGIVRLIINLLGNPQVRPYLPDEYTFEYKEDLTQWVKGNPPITVECTLGISAQTHSEDSQESVNVRCWAHGSDRLSPGLG
jgi:predicted ATP-binding protein involved in virulence